MSEHTKELWRSGVYFKPGLSVFQGDTLVANFKDEERGRQAIAEHNACLDIPTKALEDGAIKGLVDLIDSGMYLDDDLQDAIAALKPAPESTE